ncbi:MAG TPA: hypothetical protein VNW24_00315 [Stellaceae bacterium]|jgi:hypothetical protein|nr:hypothetical protein [Stellaceae bacterium]
MSRHNAALALPVDERPAGYQQLTGAALERAAIGETLAAAQAAYDELEAAASAGSLELLHNAASKLAALSRHLVKPIGAAR